jgi:predicted outer membrane repeat protein
MKALRRLLAPLLGLASVAGTARADAVVTVCGKDVWPGDPRTDLREALLAGGRITFACSGVIEFTRSHGFTGDTQIDGAGQVTLDGKGRRMFGLGSSGVRVSFTAIRIENGGLGSSSNPGSVIAGEGFVSFLDGTSVRKSQKPVWLLAGDVDVRNAWFAENTGPVLVVSEGALSISRGSRFTDNAGQVLATGPSTSVRIDDAQFFRNGGASFGGTSAMRSCDVVITKSWFADNAAAEDGGALLSRCALTVEETQFERNRAGGDGGAVFLGPGVDATMRSVRFRENQAGASGGAIAGLWSLEHRGSLRVRHGRFEGNRATRAGGAILAGESSRVEIGAGAFIENSAGTGGGALYVRQSPLFVSGSLLRRNHSGSEGAAIRSLCMPASMGRVSNSIIADNTATTGGAYYGGNMTFLNVTLVNNGGLPVQHGELCEPGSVIEFANTILLSGSTGACGGGDAQRTFKDLGHNLQFPLASCGATITVAHPLLGFFFAPLRPLSPAGGRGDNAVCSAPPINGRDIFGTHRPQGSACSIGAVEGDLSQLIARLLKRRRGDSR